MSQIRLDFIIPLNYNDQTPIDDETLAKVYDQITETFGQGLSKDNSTIDGYWLDPVKKVYVNDTNRNVWVICDDTPENSKKCDSLKLFLKDLLKQDEILIIESQVRLK